MAKKAAAKKKKAAKPIRAETFRHADFRPFAPTELKKLKKLFDFRSFAPKGKKSR